MKLFTNENNPEAAKIVIASKISQRKIDIVLVNKESVDLGHPKRLPQLVLDSGTQLFSSNASLLYLLPLQENEALGNYYLDYESNVVLPLVSMCHGKLDSKSESELRNVLDKLDGDLSNRNFFLGDGVTAADVSLWTALYPIAIDTHFVKNFFEQRKRLKDWFNRVLTSQVVFNAFQCYPMTKDSSCLSVLNSDHWFPNQSVNKLTSRLDKMSIQDGDDSSGKLKEVEQSVTEEELKLATEAWLKKTRISPKQAVNPVLPVPGEKNILITSALPYVNNVPHLGNIIGCVLSGDVFARYCRLRNYNTLYICGTDEYGTATETKALEEGLTPKQICDKYFEIHDKIYKWFNIKFDRFGRTTTPEQTEISQDMFLKLYKNGYILSDSVEQLLCENCDRYLADRFVEGTCPRCAYIDARGDQCDGCGHLINATELIKPRCKICQKTPVLRQSKQFFLDLPKIEPILKKWMEESYESWSHNAREISKAWISDGLKPRCITRDLKWGIPVPLEGYQNKVFYVWFDAPIGYISITKQYTDQWKKWWLPEGNTKVSLYQFMAKDNVPFHSVMFPASLLGSREKFTIVDNIFATEYLNYEDGKFSKSRGVGVFGTDAQDTGIPADIWRFYLLYVRPESQDSSFSWHDLALKNNSELLNILGNFINRALVFAEKNYDSKVPEMHLTKEDYELLALVNRELINYKTVIEKGKLREGIRHILSIARLGNQLMQMSQPWVLCKGNEEEQKRGATVIGLSINLSCFLSVLLYPYMPETSETIQKQLNARASVNVIEDQISILLEPGHKIGKPSPLFSKIEMSQIEKLKTRFSGRQKSKTPDKKDVPPVKTGNHVLTTDVASLEAAVAAQGDKVRQMKAAGKDKSEWQPEVVVLLDLKKKLEAAKAQNAPKVNNEATPTGDAVALEKAVEEQGNVVRKLKESGVERSQWQPELNKLLDLKKQLAELKGEPASGATGKKSKKGK